jgi:AraC family transcriptional activator of pobA
MKKDIPVYDICTLSEFKQEDILISRFAPYLAQHHKLHLAHKHTFYHLVLFTEGAGTHAIDFQQFAVKPFQIYFMIPGQVHSWNFNGPVDGYVINFSVPFFQSFC